LARFFCIDWDHDRLQVVVVTAGRNSIHIDKALSWQEPHTLDAAGAEAAGQRLRERLKAARLAPAPVLACLGRERVIFKEIRYPAGDAAQEPAVVRFQATKELTEPASRVVIDYTPLPGPTTGSDRRATISVVRQEWLKATQNLCKGAGLKLLALTPRSFGTAASVQHMEAPGTRPPEGTTVAILTVSDSWAEFTIARDGVVLFARPVATGDALLGEVRRNLALFASQAQVAPGRDGVQALYFAGDGDQAVLQERLQELLAIPVQPLLPLGADETSETAQRRAGLSGVVGLARLWARQPVPINFASPKEAKTTTSATKRKVLLGVAAGVAAAVCFFMLSQVVLGMKQDEVRERRAELNQLSARLQQLSPESKKLADLKKWDSSALSLVDELHDLTKRFPREVNFRVTRMDLTTIGNPPANSPYTMQMMVKGIVPRNKVFLVQDLIDMINIDPKHARATRESDKNSQSKDAGETQEFVLKILLAKHTEPVPTQVPAGINQPSVSRQPQTPAARKPGRN
jgi:Tfp pilus assembly PilM family ATPase